MLCASPLHLPLSLPFSNCNSQLWIYLSLLIKNANKLGHDTRGYDRRSMGLEIYSYQSLTLSTGQVLRPNLVYNIKTLNLRLPFGQKMYNSTINSRNSKLALPLKETNSHKAYWKKLTSSGQNSPIVLVNNFIKLYPTPILAKKSISIDLIQNIFKCFTPDFELTPKEFNTLKNIKPSTFELPIKLPLTQLFGKHRGEKNLLLWKPGVYKFSNKVNGHSYVGSSLTLASRLSEYLRPSLLKKRNIELAITKFGIENFELKVWFLPLEWLIDKVEMMVNSSFISPKETIKTLVSPSLGDPKELLVKVNVEKLKNLTLALEQMLILVFNPQYNEIKVAGGWYCCWYNT
jgi:hypothetical protein